MMTTAINLAICLAGLFLAGCERGEPADASPAGPAPEAAAPEIGSLVFEPISDAEIEEILPEGPTCTLFTGEADERYRMMVVTLPMEIPAASSAVVRIGGQMIRLELDTSVGSDRFDAVGLIYATDDIIARATREPGAGERTAESVVYPGLAAVMPHSAQTQIRVAGDWLCDEDVGISS